MLLTGARGTGKSSLIKALLNKYAPRGLRLIEVEKQDLIDLPDIVDQIAERPERFILYCDDLSFEADEPGYKALKVVLDGSIAAASENCLIYATSNRRHLMPEYMHENLEYRHVGEEIHPGETSEEKISLSERFGLWVSFYPFDQDEYLKIVDVWLEHFKVAGAGSEAAHKAALQWSLARGSRSGRVAWQFARDWAGKHKIKKKKNNAPMNADERDSAGVNQWSPCVGVHRTRSKSSPPSFCSGPDGSFLLAQRPAGKVYAGYWEFPGGKVEAGESAASRSRASFTKSSAST